MEVSVSSSAPSLVVNFLGTYISHAEEDLPQVLVVEKSFLKRHARYKIFIQFYVLKYLKLKKVVVEEKPPGQIENDASEQAL